MKNTIDTDLDYYLIESDDNFMSPLLIVDDEVDPYGLEYLEQDKQVEQGTISYLTFADPIPKKPDMVDYLDLECRQVFSKKIYEVLSKHYITNLQLVPAVIRGNRGIEYTDYWIANIYQEYAFLDENKSEREGDIDDNGRWFVVESMVLNEELVKKIPLEKRLVYYCKENPAYVLYHKTIVNIIMSANPEGLIFTPVSEWRF